MEQMYRVHVNVDIFVDVLAENEAQAIDNANGVVLDSLTYYNECDEETEYEDVSYTVNEHDTRINAIIVE